MCIIL